MNVPDADAAEQVTAAFEDHRLLELIGVTAEFATDVPAYGAPGWVVSSNEQLREAAVILAARAHRLALQGRIGETTPPSLKSALKGGGSTLAPDAWPPVAIPGRPGWRQVRLPDGTAIELPERPTERTVTP